MEPGSASAVEALFTAWLPAEKQPRWYYVDDEGALQGDFAAGQLITWAQRHPDRFGKDVQMVGVADSAAVTFVQENGVEALRPFLRPFHDLLRGGRAYKPVSVAAMSARLEEARATTKSDHHAAEFEQQAALLFDAFPDAWWRYQGQRGADHGPVSSSSMQALVQEGSVKPSTYVYQHRSRTYEDALGSSAVGRVYKALRVMVAEHAAKRRAAAEAAAAGLGAPASAASTASAAPAAAAAAAVASSGGGGSSSGDMAPHAPQPATALLTREVVINRAGWARLTDGELLQVFFLTLGSPRADGAQSAWWYLNQDAATSGRRPECGPYSAAQMISKFLRHDKPLSPLETRVCGTRLGLDRPPPTDAFHRLISYLASLRKHLKNKFHLYPRVAAPPSAPHTAAPAGFPAAAAAAAAPPSAAVATASAPSAPAPFAAPAVVLAAAASDGALAVSEAHVAAGAAAAASTPSSSSPAAAKAAGMTPSSSVADLTEAAGGEDEDAEYEEEDGSKAAAAGKGAAHAGAAPSVVDGWPQPSASRMSPRVPELSSLHAIAEDMTGERNGGQAAAAGGAGPPPTAAGGAALSRRSSRPDMQLQPSASLAQQQHQASAGIAIIDPAQLQTLDVQLFGGGSGGGGGLAHSVSEDWLLATGSGTNACSSSQNAVEEGEGDDDGVLDERARALLPFVHRLFHVDFAAAAAAASPATAAAAAASLPPPPQPPVKVYWWLLAGELSGEGSGGDVTGPLTSEMMVKKWRLGSLAPRTLLCATEWGVEARQLPPPVSKFHPLDFLLTWTQAGGSYRALDSAELAEVEEDRWWLAH